MDTLDIEYICKYAPKSIIESVMSSCLIQRSDEDKAISEIIIFINMLCGGKEGIDEENSILAEYRKRIDERIQELKGDEDGFGEKEEIESIFLSDARGKEIQLSETAARLFFEHLYALSDTGYGEEYIIPKFLIEFHIAVLWDEGNMKTCVPTAVMDMYKYYR